MTLGSQGQVMKKYVGEKARPKTVLVTEEKFELEQHLI